MVVREDTRINRTKLPAPCIEVHDQDVRKDPRAAGAGLMAGTHESTIEAGKGQAAVWWRGDAW
jgi:hypothetical protein